MRACKNSLHYFGYYKLRLHQWDFAFMQHLTDVKHLTDTMSVRAKNLKTKRIRCNVIIWSMLFWAHFPVSMNQSLPKSLLNFHTTYYCHLNGGFGPCGSQWVRLTQRHQANFDSLFHSENNIAHIHPTAKCSVVDSAWSTIETTCPVLGVSMLCGLCTFTILS